MSRQTKAIGIETLESRTLMSMTGGVTMCVHADAPSMQPGAQGYKVQQMGGPAFGHENALEPRGGSGRVSFPLAQMNRIEMALIRAAIALANQLRASEPPLGDTRAEPAPPPPPVAEPVAPTPQSIAPPVQQLAAQLVVSLPQNASDVGPLASSSIRQEILSTDFSSKAVAAASFVSSAPVMVATPIFSSAYASSAQAWHAIESTVGAVAPEVANIVTNPAVASTVAAVIAPAEKIFNFVEMGSPMVFLGDALANFAEESAAVPNVLASAPTSQTAWIVTGLVVAVDAALLIYYYRTRGNRAFSTQALTQRDPLEEMD